METESRPNILLLVMDACRADVLPPYGGSADASAVSRLAESGTVFERALSPAPWTLPAMTSVLTGRYPHEHGATSRGFELDDGRTVTRDLSDAGYQCVHLSPKTWIGDWLPQGRGFDRVVEFTGPEHRRFDAGADVRTLSEGVARGPEWYAAVVRRALRSDAPLHSLANAAAFKLREATADTWRDNVRASERAARAADERFAALAGDADDRPFFLYCHLMNPHLPFYLPEEFRSDGRPPGCDTDEEEEAWMADLMDDIWAVRTGERELSGDELAYLRTRYEDEVAYADRAVGRILDSLREHGLAEDTLVVVTGDHGEHLGERVPGRPSGGTERTLLDHQTSVRFPVLRVPLVVRYPGDFEGGERRSDLVQTNFVAETVRALAGLAHDESRSLLAGDRNATRDVALAEYAGVVPSHPPESVDEAFVLASRRTAVTGRWKLDEVDGTRRAAALDWEAGEVREVPLDDVPDGVRERLSAALAAAESGDGEDVPAAGASGEIPDDVADNLADLGYL